MNNYIKIEIKTDSTEQLEILIAELSEINFEAFEENENFLSAFIKEEKLDEDELKENLSTKNLSFAKSTIEETNWNAKWESEFEPIIVENFVAIRAAFHPPIHTTKHEIIITPKMSFGTGHHATTYLMLQQMEQIDFIDKTVLDFGTGTGILAIMAEKSGAEKITAIDNDEWSVTNALENIEANNCKKINVFQKDNLDIDAKFDIVIANINLNVISNAVQPLKNITKPASILLLSGFLKSDEQKIIDQFSENDFVHIYTTKKHEWIAMLLTKS